MEKLSFFMVSLFVSISSAAFAQFSCTGAVPITNGNDNKKTFKVIKK